MRLLARYILIFCALAAAPALKGQTLAGLSDSVFEALRYGEFDSLKKFFPTYNELKATIDSMDLDKQAAQILISQQQASYALKQSFKSFKKEADRLNIDLEKMEKLELRHPVFKSEGKRYSVVEVDCRYKKHNATVLFTVIEMNDAWYLAENFRILEREVEEEPDYEKIDKEAERRRQKRDQAREDEREKAARDSVKADKNRKLEADKKDREELKKKKEEEKARLKAEREAEKQRKKEELERKKKEKAQNKKSPPVKTQPQDSLPPRNDTFSR